MSTLTSDDIAQQCIDFIVDGWPSSNVELGGELAVLYHNRSKLTMYAGYVMFGTRFYIPARLRKVYLERVHDGHQGIERCRRRASELFWWPSVYDDICRFIAECDDCIRNSRVRHQPFHCPPLPAGPWLEVNADVFVFRDNLYLIIVDYYSKWVEVVSIANQTATTVIAAMQTVFSHLGVPTVVRSDNGPCFAASVFASFANEWGFKHVLSSSRYPQSNGLVERAVGTVKSLWRKCTSKSRALLAYRTTPLSYTKYSPGDLMFGRPMRSALGPPCTDKCVNYEEYECDVEHYRSNVRREWGRNHKVSTLSRLVRGQWVWVKTPRQPGFKAVVQSEADVPDSYWVRKDMGLVKRNRKYLFPVARSNQYDTVLFDIGTDTNSTPDNVVSADSGAVVLRDNDAAEPAEPAELAANANAGAIVNPLFDNSYDLFDDHSVTVPGSAVTASNIADLDCPDGSVFEPAVHGNEAPPVLSDSVPTPAVPGATSTPNASVIDDPPPRRSYRSDKTYISRTGRRVRFKRDSNYVYEPP